MRPYDKGDIDRDPIPEPERPPLQRQWQELDGNDESDTMRMIVPGGWIYRCRVWTNGNVSVAICFVPYSASEDNLDYD